MFKHWKWLGVSLVALLVLGLAYAVPLSMAAPKPKPPAAGAVTYSITLLPAPLTSAVGMNNSGDVVGERFLYIAETREVIDLNTLVPGDVTILDAVDVNDPAPDLSFGRQIIGNCVVVGMDGHPAYRATVEYDEVGDLVLSDFTVLEGPVDFPLIHPYAINNNGDVVGKAESDDPDTSSFAFLWTQLGGMENIVGGTEYSIARDINDDRQVTGNMNVDGEGHAFRYTPGSGVQDLGGLRKRPTSHGYGINSQGQVTGHCVGPYYYSRAFRYTDGVGMVDLRTLYKDRYSSSEGRAINSSGHVVGRSREGHDWTDPRRAGFLYTDESGMVDLATLISNPPAGWDPGSIYPNAISDPEAGEDFGQIIGSVNVDGVGTPFIMTPDG